MSNFTLLQTFTANVEYVAESKQGLYIANAFFSAYELLEVVKAIKNLENQVGSLARNVE